MALLLAIIGLVLLFVSLVASLFCFGCLVYYLAARRQLARLSQDPVNEGKLVLFAMRRGCRLRSSFTDAHHAAWKDDWLIADVVADGGCFHVVASLGVALALSIFAYLWLPWPDRFPYQVTCGAVYFIGAFLVAGIYGKLLIWAIRRQVRSMADNIRTAAPDEYHRWLADYQAKREDDQQRKARVEELMKTRSLSEEDASFTVFKEKEIRRIMSERSVTAYDAEEIFQRRLQMGCPGHQWEAEYTTVPDLFYPDDPDRRLLFATNRYRCKLCGKIKK